MHIAIHILDVITVLLALCLAGMIRRRRFHYVVVGVMLTVVSVSVVIRFWRVWLRFISTETSTLAKTILAFVLAHPHMAHTFRVLINTIPDIAFFLLAIAGISYLMPELVNKIGSNRTLRLAIFGLFVVFGVLAIVVNAINRTSQEEQESQLQSTIDTQGKKIDGLREQQTKTLTFLVNSKGQPNEAERRRQILETLRGRYVIDHPEVPVTMLTGDSWPPKEWMDKHLKALGETFLFVPPAPEISSKPEAPPAIDVVTLVGDDVEQHARYYYDPNKTTSWSDREHAYISPFTAYLEGDLKTMSVPLDVGTKGWARIIFALFNTGGSKVVHPTILIDSASVERNMLINRVNQRQSLKPDGQNEIPYLQFGPPETTDILPFNVSQNAPEFGVDITVSQTVNDFQLGFRIYGDNLPAHMIVIPIHVRR